MMYMEITTTIKDDAIRHHFDEKSGKWYFSVVDVIAIITKSSDPRNYWKVLKNRLKKAQNQLVTECNQLKMKANDGKFYLTDTAPAETILKIIELISEKNVSPFREYFDNLERGGRGEVTEQKSPHSLISATLTKTYPQVTEDEEEFVLMIDGHYTNDSVIVEAFTAGVSIENISISATSKILTIKGERKIKPEPSTLKPDTYSYQEITWGKFSRTIKLPYEIEIDKIEATEYQGHLSIKMPMKNMLYNKKVKIESVK